MDETNPGTEQSLHPDIVQGEWMLPAAALDRFEPPADMVIAATVEKEVGRYGFRIGTLGFLITPGVGSEVMQIPTIWTLPGAPPWLLGLINLRGSLVPVYELRQVMGLGQRAAGEKPLVMVFDQGEKAVGILIDDFPQLLTGLSSLPTLPHLPSVLNGNVRAGHVKDGMIWLEFHHASFFGELIRAEAA